MTGLTLILIIGRPLLFMVFSIEARRLQSKRLAPERKWLMNPDILILTLEQMESELPQLTGSKQWATLYPQYTQYRDQLQAQNNHVVRLQAAANLIDLFAPYKAVQTQLRVAIEGLDIYQTMLTKLADIARQLNAETEIITKLEEAAAFRTHSVQTRLIILHGIGQKAQSIKWQNFEFDFGDAIEMTETAAGILAAFSDIISPDSNHLLAAAGVLLIIRGLLKATTEEISEQDASVFWGVIQAQRHNVARRVNTARVLEHTNQERAKVHLPSLTEQQVRHALYNLVELGSVEQVDKEHEIWCIIEKYKSKT